jgi:hypothetical protein
MVRRPPSAQQTSRSLKSSQSSPNEEHVTGITVEHIVVPLGDLLSIDKSNYSLFLYKNITLPSGHGLIHRRSKFMTCSKLLQLENFA